MEYETTREKFNLLVKDYNAYVELYRFLNNGSIEGIAPFSEFYLRFTYGVVYQDINNNQSLGN